MNQWTTPSQDVWAKVHIDPNTVASAQTTGAAHPTSPRLLKWGFSAQMELSFPGKSCGSMLAFATWTARTPMTSLLTWLITTITLKSLTNWLNARIDPLLWFYRGFKIKGESSSTANVQFVFSWVRMLNVLVLPHFFWRGLEQAGFSTLIDLHPLMSARNSSMHRFQDLSDSPVGIVIY